MGSDTNIAWTDHTFNPWWGCTKVSPGCASCYAESWDARWKGGHWGKDAPRRFFPDAHWREPLKWNDAAAKAGKRARVFCASMADVFDDRRDLDIWRTRLWGLISLTPHLDWQLLTKRPENLRSLLPYGWLQTPMRNVWLGTTVEDQRRADERIPELLKVPAAVRFLSVEPLLEHVALRCTSHLSWVIVGGESGAGARPFDLAWARSIIHQCKAAGVSCFFKQAGTHPYERAAANLGARQGYDPNDLLAGASEPRPPQMQGWTRIHTSTETFYSRQLRLKDRKGGDPEEWPEDLRVREFPR